MSSVEVLLGRVTQQLPAGGESRPGQVQMAELVAETIADRPITRAPTGRPQVLLIEAGTGTGKSLAYLVPAVAEGKRTVVATATIALQGQLVDKDSPLVANGLDREVTAAVLKGRGNYLCRQRLAEFDRAKHSEQLDLMGGTTPGESMVQIRDWSEQTIIGDREELDPAPPPAVWRAVSVGADECPGAKKCPSGDSCFAETARQRALEADIIVTNHHYYGLNLASGGVLLPDHDVVVFDEAHHLPEVIGATCGNELSGGRLRSLARRVRGVVTDDELAFRIDRSAIDLDNVLRTMVGDQADFSGDLTNLLVTARDRVDRALNALNKANKAAGKTANKDSDTAAKIERAVVNATNVVGDIDEIIGSSPDDVTWVDGSPDHPVLKRTPLDVGDILRGQLWGERAVVLTSATIPDALGEQLGLEPEEQVVRVGSPFRYEELGLLYCATHLPEPRLNSFRQAVRDEMFDLINAAGGRTLGLFTSASAMREAADDLRERLDFPILMQGEKSKPMLIEEFQADPRTVLLATMSFWQGVDLPGDSLTLVTIDRLPFPRPDEPVSKAKRDRAGPAAFRTVDLPRAQILLAQAAGRLVRRSTDHGVVAVLDTRLSTKKSYRWDLINALPPFRRTRDRDEVMEYLRSLDTT